MVFSALKWVKENFHSTKVFKHKSFANIEGVIFILFVEIEKVAPIEQPD